jgi:hypothetical protein
MMTITKSFLLNRSKYLGKFIAAGMVVSEAQLATILSIKRTSITNITQGGKIKTVTLTRK